MQDALPEQGKTSPAESHTLQKFELIHFPLDAYKYRFFGKEG
jgi:hypothetical protein